MFKFLQGLDGDIQRSLLAQLRDLWTHCSTAIEGNTLTLGDTHFVLEEGLTVSGKPLKDHQEVVGHARAIEIVYSLVGKLITESDIFNLHKAVQTETVVDMYKPYGAWKAEPNGTYAVAEDGKQVYIEYALPRHVPALMQEFIATINATITNALTGRSITLEQAPKIYAKLHMGFVHIHPFWDGNGRIARLLANLPVLNAGLPPIVIKQENRREYIQVLSNYQQKVGVLTASSGVWPNDMALQNFTDFCSKAYALTEELIERAFEQQKARH